MTWLLQDLRLTKSHICNLRRLYLLLMSINGLVAGLLFSSQCSHNFILRPLSCLPNVVIIKNVLLLA